MAHLDKFAHCSNITTIVLWFVMLNVSKRPDEGCRSGGLQNHFDDLGIFHVHQHRTVHGRLAFRLHQNMAATTGIQPMPSGWAVKHLNHWTTAARQFQFHYSGLSCGFLSASVLGWCLCVMRLAYIVLPPCNKGPSPSGLQPMTLVPGLPESSLLLPLILQC